jgi:uncharacterized membrane protein YdjX (TVP38/TMEM64 family)
MPELLYFITAVIQPILIFTPEAITIASANALLGSEKAFFIGYVGIMIGIIIMYAIGRFGRDGLIAKIVKPEKLAKFQDYNTKKELVVLITLFIFPILPDNVICIGAGLAKLSFRNFIFVALFTKLITTFIYSYFTKFPSFIASLFP